jgi:hypothetical protein
MIDVVADEFGFPLVVVAPIKLFLPRLITAYKLFLILVKSTQILCYMTSNFVVTTAEVY